MKQTENRECMFVSHFQTIRIPNTLQEIGKILSVRKQHSKMKEDECLKYHTIGHFGKFLRNGKESSCSLLNTYRKNLNQMKFNKTGSVRTT